MWTCWQNHAHSQCIVGPTRKLATATITQIVRGGKEWKQTDESTSQGKITQNLQGDSKKQQNKTTSQPNKQKQSQKTLQWCKAIPENMISQKKRQFNEEMMRKQKEMKERQKSEKNWEKYKYYWDENPTKSNSLWVNMIKENTCAMATWGHVCKVCTKCKRAEGWREGRKGNYTYVYKVGIPEKENKRRTGSIQLLCQVKKQKVKMTPG